MSVNTHKELDPEEKMKARWRFEARMRILQEIGERHRKAVQRCIESYQNRNQLPLFPDNQEYDK